MLELSITGIRAQVQGDITDIRAQMQGDITDFKQEMVGQFSKVMEFLQEMKKS